MILKDGKLVSSYSQIDLYLQCPYKWYLRYILKEEQLPAKALVYGIAIHSTMEEFLNTIKDGTAPSKEFMLTIYDMLFYKDDIPFDSKEEEQEYYKEGIVMIERLYNPVHEVEKLMNTAEIVGIEMPFEVQIGDVTVIGFIDLVLRTEEGIIIIDHKSGKKLYDKSKLETNLQFPIYAMAIQQEYGQMPIKYYYNFTKVHKPQEVSLDLQRINEAKKQIVKVFKKMGGEKHTCKPTNLCYWCDYSMHKLNLCKRSSSFRPKNK